MNCYTLLLLLSASSVFASFSSIGTTDSEISSSGSLEDELDSVSYASFNPQIQNLIIHEFGTDLLIGLLSDEKQAFLNHLKYLVDNNKKLILSKAEHGTQIINVLSALVSSYKLRVRQQEQDLMSLKAEILKLKKRYLKIRKQGLAEKEASYENKLKAMKKMQVKLSKMEAFTNYCNMVGEDRCFKLAPMNSPNGENEFVKYE